MNRHSTALFGLPGFVWRLILAAAIVAAFTLARADAGECCQPAPTPVTPVAFEQPRDSWVFMPSRYTHDPETGSRVAQYAMKPPVEPLDDPRLVTSGYRRSRTVIRGADGSVDSIYRVQSYGNGRGGLDAEWERFHDAWRGSTVAGGQFQAFFPPFYGYGYGSGGPGYGGPNNGGPGYGGPNNGGPGYSPGYGGGYGPGAGYPNGRYGRGYGYGPGYGQPDAGRLDPDGADGYQEQLRRVPDRQFFNPGLPPFRDQDYQNPQHDHDQ